MASDGSRGARGACVLVNGDVRAMSVGAGSAEAVGFRDGRVVAVGTRSAVVEATGVDAAVVDVGGATVLPGFVDAHQHPAIAALYGGGLPLAAPAVTRVPDLLGAIAAEHARLPPGDWLVATGWDESTLAERRAPTRTELDDAAPGRAVFALHYSCHRAVASSRALSLAGIEQGTPDPSGGSIGRDARGMPDGLLVERGMSAVESLARGALVARDAEGFLGRLGRHFEALVRAGITCVCDAAVPGDLAALYAEADRRGLLPFPVVLMPVSTRGYLEEPVEALSGPVTGTSAGRLRHGPVKLVMDGAPACSMCLGWWQMAAVSVRTFALVLQRGSLDPVRVGMSTRPRVGGKLRTGIELYTEQEATRFVARAVGEGFAVATHAEGNAAIDRALLAYEAAGSRLHAHGPPRLEHVIFADRELCRRIAGVGAMVVAQPHFLSLPAFGSAPTVPGLPTKPLRWLLDAGAIVAGSSDFPVTGFDPLDGVRSAVRRSTPDGRKREPEQAVTLDEALAMYTRAAATAAGCAADCGTLEPGKRADAIVLDRALRTDADLDGARVRATFVAGELVHGRP